MKFLFVCTGNICRSPTAEGIFSHLVNAADLSTQIKTDGCGIQGWHVGNAPDNRSVEAALRRGYDLSALRARQLHSTDFEKFDYLLAMDHGHYDSLMEQAPIGKRDRIHMFLQPVEAEFEQIEVPDPYYGGEHGFELVLDMVESASHAWIKIAQNKL